jgi:hypothetical protein
MVELLTTNFDHRQFAVICLFPVPRCFSAYSEPAEQFRLVNEDPVLGGDRLFIFAGSVFHEDRMRNLEKI